MLRIADHALDIQPVEGSPIKAFPCQLGAGLVQREVEQGKDSSINLVLIIVWQWWRLRAQLRHRWINAYLAHR